MSSTTTIAQQGGDLTHRGVLRLRGQHTIPNTSWFPELNEKGFTVVKNVLSREEAAAYVDRAFSWLEGFDTGFQRDDRSTWTKDHMPAFKWGGMFQRHGVQHEQWVWDIRQEAAVIDVFAKVWGTDELLVSYDAVNISLPYDASEGVHRAPWPHVDQSPLRRWKHCVQGIVNLLDVGPKDGSLMVLDGSLQLFEEFFVTHEKEAPPEGWPTRDSFGYTAKHLEWFYERGCAWKKVLAEPGDVILWDSRLIHYGAAAEGDNPRVATYVCYKPAADITPERLEHRKDLFSRSIGTSHDPVLFRETQLEKLTEDERTAPRLPPQLSHRGKQLVGLELY